MVYSMRACFLAALPVNIIINCHYFRHGCCVFTPFSVFVALCWLVGLSAGLHKNSGADFHQTLMEDGSRPSIDPTKDAMGKNWSPVDFII